MPDSNSANQLPPYFADHVRRLFLEPFHVSESEVKEALAGPVKVESVTNGPKTTTLILAPAKQGIPHSSLLMQGELYQRANNIEYVLRVPDSFADNPRLAASPLRTIEAIAGAYGIEFSVGTHRSKYIEKKLLQVPRSGQGEPMTVHSYPGAVYASSTDMRFMEKDGVRYALCVVCFVLDSKLYKQAIGLPVE